MIGVIITAHSPLAQALHDTAKNVVPNSGPTAWVGIGDQDQAAQFEAKLRKVVKQSQSSAGVLILTDMFGGTPSNISLTLHQPGKVEVLTGANLAMVIKALQLSMSDVKLSDVAAKVKSCGQQAISVASEVLDFSKREHSENE